MSTSARGVGRSVDIPKRYERKVQITLVHYDAIPDNADADLSQAMLTDKNGLPLDEVVIRKMDFERFINTLTTTEERYIRFKMVDELPDRMAAAALSMSVEKLHAHEDDASQKDRRPFHGLTPFLPCLRATALIQRPV